MKKIITLLILFFCLMQTALAFYQDVPEDHRFYEPIKFLYDLNLLPKEENTFYPNELLTEADFYNLVMYYLDIDNIGFNINLVGSKLLAKHQVLSELFELLNIDLPSFFDKKDFIFKDLDENSKTAYVAYKAMEIGIIDENNPEYFKMAKKVTRGELADYLFQIYQYEPQEVDEDEVKEILKAQLLENATFTDLVDVFVTLKTEYFGKNGLDDDDLINGAIKGMVTRVDDIYTDFYEGDEVKSFLNSLNSSYEGVGMSIDNVDGDIVIIAPFQGSPAEEAGLKSGDLLRKVNDTNVEGMDIENVVNLLVGPKGTEVEVTVDRDGKNLNFIMVRKFVLLNSAVYTKLNRNEKNIGYISLISFSNDTYNQFLDAVNSALDDEVEGLIIDLRNNPGGYIDVAVSIAGVFFNDIRDVVVLEFSNGNKEFYRSDGNGLLSEMEVVVLVNQGSASASEILAGTLQDYKTAQIIGVNTYGKFSVQKIKELNSGGIFRYTISNWLTPYGRNVGSDGLTPDLIVENYNLGDDQLEKAIQELIN